MKETNISDLSKKEIEVNENKSKNQNINTTISKKLLILLIIIGILVVGTAIALCIIFLRKKNDDNKKTFIEDNTDTGLSNNSTNINNNKTNNTNSTNYGVYNYETTIGGSKIIFKTRNLINTDTIIETGEYSSTSMDEIVFLVVDGAKLTLKQNVKIEKTGENIKNINNLINKTGNKSNKQFLNRPIEIVDSITKRIPQSNHNNELEINHKEEPISNKNGMQWNILDGEPLRNLNNVQGNITEEGSLKEPNGDPPDKPEGDQENMSNGEPPDKPEGDQENMSNGEPPDKPEGDQENMPNGEPPDKPEGNQENMSNGEPPDKPEGENDNGPSVGDDSYSFYGINSAIVVLGEGSKAIIKGISISTDSYGANAVVALNSGEIEISNCTIRTSKDSSRGLHSTYKGKIFADTINITTKGGSCANLATDRGEGTIIAKNMILSTEGSGSPLIYSTGQIEVSDSQGHSSGAQICVIEGKNSAKLNNCQFTCTGKGNRGNVDISGVMIYQSMSGDAGVGMGSFESISSILQVSESNIQSSVPMFFITNTEAMINLTNISASFESGLLIKAEGTNEWGNSGKNGGKVSFTIKEKRILGKIYSDDISSVVVKYDKNTINPEDFTTEGNVTIEELIQ